MSAHPILLASLDDSDAIALRYVDLHLREATEQLGVDASVHDVRAARRALHDAERRLGALVNDPWEPSVAPLREAREILSSHLLAALECEKADVAPPVIARVLRRGAASTRKVLEGRPATADPSVTT